MTDDPIRELLGSIDPSPFIWTPPGHVAILRSRVVDAGVDAEEVDRWVSEHGGSLERTMPITSRVHSIGYGRPVRREDYYEISLEALGRGAAAV